jgi:hypothetical protein
MLLRKKAGIAGPRRPSLAVPQHIRIGESRQRLASAVCSLRVRYYAPVSAATTLKLPPSLIKG